jgi:hypothetical protein
VLAVNRKELRKHERKVLLGLVDYFYGEGHTSAALNDPETGGIYERKLAARLGYDPGGEDGPDARLQAASVVLASNGWVRRARRDPDSPLMAVWPTAKGLDHAEYLRARRWRKPLIVLTSDWKPIWVSVVTALLTTIVALFVGSLFGLFGPRGG